MSRQNNSLRVWTGWLLAAALLAGAALAWMERQWIVDSVAYYQYTPTPKVESVVNRLDLTDKGKFLFYASHPLVEGRDEFNEHCERREANSPILGCYSNGRIFVYDITDKRLSGIKEVTAAHELLHAAYERLSDSEKKHLDALLLAVYEDTESGELKERMAYYDKNQPGETHNELHSIVPTEVSDIGEELEEYYKKFFNNRKFIVDLHRNVSEQFHALSKESKKLSNQIDTLVKKINSTTSAYNEGVASLNQRVHSFNQRAQSPGGFSSNYDFILARNALNSERANLEQLRSQVEQDLAIHKKFIARLEAINAESESLNQSIDSVLADEPEI